MVIITILNSQNTIIFILQIYITRAILLEVLSIVKIFVGPFLWTLYNITSKLRRTYLLDKTYCI